MSEREELEAVIEKAIHEWHSAGPTPKPPLKVAIATDLLSSGYTRGNGELVEAVRPALTDETWSELREVAEAYSGLNDRLGEALHFLAEREERIRKALSDSEEAVPSGEMKFELGAGRVVVTTGTYEGAPAVFIEPAKTPGKPGDSSERERLPADRIIEGGAVLTVPSVRRARDIADALVGQPLPTPPVLQELHGDGVRDDTEAVQKRVNAGLTIGDSHE